MAKTLNKWPEPWVKLGMVNVVIPSERNEVIRGCHNGTVYTVPVNREIEIPRIIYNDIKNARSVVEQSRVDMREFVAGTKKVN